HQIQKILFERVVFAPIWENGFIRGVGPRVQEGSLELIPAFPYSAPMEDVRLKPYAMRIVAIEPVLVDVPLASPVRGVHGTTSVQRSVLARVTTDEGVEGWG